MSAFLAMLNHDHANFLHLLDAFETQVNVAADGGRPSFHVLKGVIAYFRGYSRQIHHPREELLLDVLKRHAPELTDKVNEIIESHRHLPQRLTVLENALEAFENDALAGQRLFLPLARQFIAFERAHIAEENRHLVPAAIGHLTAEDWQWIDSSLGDRKDPMFGQAVVAPFTRMREAIFTTDDQTHHTHAGA
jgi:hemerythrin-like domain-containing protein